MKYIIVKILRNLKLALGLYKKVYFNDLTRVNPVSPFFGIERGKSIDRYYIEKFLDENRRYIKGRVLEVAEDTYSRRFVSPETSENTIFETLHYDGTNGKTTIIGDLTDVKNLPKNRYDCFICTQTYNFIFEVQKAIEGTYFLLNNGGVVLATVAGISQISRYDMDRWGDYWRFTDKSIKLLFEKAGFSKIQVMTFGNSLAATAFLQGVVLEDMPKGKLLDETDIDYQVIIGIVAFK